MSSVSPSTRLTSATPQANHQETAAQLLDRLDAAGFTDMLGGSSSSTQASFTPRRINVTQIYERTLLTLARGIDFCLSLPFRIMSLYLRYIIIPAADGMVSSYRYFFPQPQVEAPSAKAVTPLKSL